MTFLINLLYIYTVLWCDFKHNATSSAVCFTHDGRERSPLALIVK